MSVANRCHGLTGNASSIERTFLGANTPKNKSSREIKFKGTKVPGPFRFISESSRERISRFAPRSELVQE